MLGGGPAAGADDVDPEVAQGVGGADARQLQEPGRADGARREDDLDGGAERLDAVLPRDLDADGAPDAPDAKGAV